MSFEEDFCYCKHRRKHHNKHQDAVTDCKICKCCGYQWDLRERQGA